jgi:predicted component of viral defense system (DUF524 family)
MALLRFRLSIHSSAIFIKILVDEAFARASGYSDAQDMAAFAANRQALLKKEGYDHLTISFCFKVRALNALILLKAAVKSRPGGARFESS